MLAFLPIAGGPIAGQPQAASGDAVYVLPLEDIENETTSSDEGLELTFTFGPLPDDIIAAADLIAGMPEEDQPADEFDYDFSFTLLEDAQVYSAALQDDEGFDEFDYDFASSPLASDASINELIGAYVEDGEDDDIEYDFSSAPLSADAVLIDDAVGQVFDEGEPNDDGVELTHFSGPLSDDLIELIGASFEDADNDDIDYDFTSPPLSDDAAVPLDMLCALLEEASADDDLFDYSFFADVVGADAATTLRRRTHTRAGHIPSDARGNTAPPSTRIGKAPRAIRQN